MSHPVRFFSLLLALACPVFALAHDNMFSEQPARTKSALLVVDAQVGVLSSIWESKRVIGNLETLVGKARSAGVPVIWVQHSDDDEMKYGSQGWKLAPNFVPSAKEIVIHKKYNSSFASTDLDQRLQALGVSRIVLAGALTNWCLRSTAYAAVDRGYNLALVSDAHSTQPLQLPDGKTIPAESIVADLNAVFEWVSVPNVRTEVSRTADVAF
jgi:nicotinamidase-related amidase